MTKDEDKPLSPISFMGYNLNELGEVEGAIPVLKHFTDELHDRIIQEREGYVYRTCMQLEIDPDVLKKQLIEIRRLNTIIREKDEQIEKMKCCGNCSKNKLFIEDGKLKCEGNVVSSLSSDIKITVCDEWKLAE